MTASIVLLAVLSIWEYPAVQPEHERLAAAFAAALRANDFARAEACCRRGVEILPDDPIWHYNLGCALARSGAKDRALGMLEKAIDLGYRDADAIAKDADFRTLAADSRFAELVDYARSAARRPMLTGPLSCVAATGRAGEPLTIGEQNLSWDFDAGCFAAKVELSDSGAGPYGGFLYMNRDDRHSLLTVTNYPGLTPVSLDQEGRERRMDVDFPNLLFPCPAFVNCSRALTAGPYWRSLPRALMTMNARLLKAQQAAYLSNQFVVFPANADTAPVGTNGDVFASVAPYWLVTAGRSWSDRPYLDAALRAAAALPPETRTAAVSRKLLAPTLQTLIRKSLKGVGPDEADYLGPKAHPTAFPPDGLDLPRLIASARDLKPSGIPPLAAVRVTAAPPAKPPRLPELTYVSAFAWAFVLRAPDEVRRFFIRGAGAEDYAFAAVHGDPAAVTVERMEPDTARVTLRRSALSPTNRVDVAVFGRGPGTGWGAPAFVSFAVVDRNAPYCDPVLEPPEPEAK